VATSQPRKSYPREGKSKIEKEDIERYRKEELNEYARIAAGWIPFTQVAKLAVLIGEISSRTPQETFSFWESSSFYRSKIKFYPKILGYPNVFE